MDGLSRKKRSSHAQCIEELKCGAEEATEELDVAQKIGRYRSLRFHEEFESIYEETQCLDRNLWAGFK